MCVGARSRILVSTSFSEKFEVKVGFEVKVTRDQSAVHHSPGSTLTQILCRMSMENVLCRWSGCCSWNVEGLMTKMPVHREMIRSQRYWMWTCGKTKVMISSRDTIHTTPLNVLVQYAGNVLRGTWSSLVDVGFGFAKSVLISQVDWLKILILGGGCLVNAQASDGRHCVEFQLIDSKLDVVDNIIYLGDFICPVGGCDLASIKRCCSA